MTGSMKIRAALVLLRLAILGLLVVGLLLGDASLQPWVIGGAVLFVAALVVSLVLALAERQSVNG